MRIFIIENNLNGILSAIFYSYENKIFPDKVCHNDFQCDIQTQITEIPTDEKKANRVYAKLKRILSVEHLNDLSVAFRSGERDKNTIIFNYVRKIIDENKDITSNYANKHVYSYYGILLKVKNELHRFKGFIRFYKTSEGIYYAKFEPDNDICELLLPHFIRRYASMPFILHDTKNNVISAYFNGNKSTVRKKVAPLTVKDEFATLFKKYYDTVNIESRRNLKQMFNYMPRRYHKNLPEKNELI